MMTNKCARKSRNWINRRHDDLEEEYEKEIAVEFTDFVRDILDDFMDDGIIDIYSIDSAIDDFYKYLKDSGPFKPSVDFDTYVANAFESACDDYGDAKYEQWKDER